MDYSAIEKRVLAAMPGLLAESSVADRFAGLSLTVAPSRRKGLRGRWGHRLLPRYRIGPNGQRQQLHATKGWRKA